MNYVQLLPRVDYFWHTSHRSILTSVGVLSLLSLTNFLIPRHVSGSLTSWF